MDRAGMINSTRNIDRYSVVPVEAAAEEQIASNIHLNGYVLGPSDQAWSFQNVKISPITAPPAAKFVAKRKKRKAWSKVEDDYLIVLVKRYDGCDLRWPQIAVQLTETFEVTRSGKQCRERWLNHLRPDIKKGKWTEQEEALIEYFYQNFGAKWSTMAKLMKNRTDNDIKNKWYSMKRARERKTAPVSNAFVVANETKVGIRRKEHVEAHRWTAMSEISPNSQQIVGKIPEFATAKARPFEVTVSPTVTDYGFNENSSDLKNVYHYQV